VPRCRDQPPGQRETEATPLPGVGDDGSVFGPIGARLAVESDDRHQFAGLVRIQRHQGVPLLAVDLGEVASLGLAELGQRREEALVDRPVAQATVEPTKGRDVGRSDRPHRHTRAVCQHDHPALRTSPRRASASRRPCRRCHVAVR
jgi:hypothetical protein